MTYALTEKLARTERLHDPWLVKIRRDNLEAELAEAERRVGDAKCILEIRRLSRVTAELAVDHAHAMRRQARMEEVRAQLELTDRRANVEEISKMICEMMDGEEK